MVAVPTSIECFTFIIFWTGPTVMVLNTGTARFRLRLMENSKGPWLYPMICLFIRPEREGEFCILASLAAPKIWKSGKHYSSDIYPASCLCPDFSYPFIFSLRQKVILFLIYSQQRFVPLAEKLSAGSD